MRLIVMFDLPTNTKEERKRANKFRNFLLQDGFYMLQYSVYIRICNGLENVHLHEERIKANVPPYGHIRSFCMTELQYKNVKTYIGNAIPHIDMEKEEILISLF